MQGSRDESSRSSTSDGRHRPADYGKGTWHNTLTAVRQEYLLDTSSIGAEILQMVMHGVRHADGIPRELVRRGFTPGKLGLSATAHMLAALQEKRALLEKELPSPEEIAEAEQRAAPLVAEVGDANARCAHAWQQFVAALEAAEIAGREFAMARRAAHATVSALRTVATDYALPISAPATWSPDQRDAQLVDLLGQFMRVVAVAEPDVMMDRELAIIASMRNAGVGRLGRGAPWAFRTGPWTVITSPATVQPTVIYPRITEVRWDPACPESAGADTANVSPSAR